jgi:ABC-type Zn2+ transport system substrate-binding protein/surface adhesin
LRRKKWEGYNNKQSTTEQTTIINNNKQRQTNKQTNKTKQTTTNNNKQQQTNKQQEKTRNKNKQHQHQHQHQHQDQDPFYLNCGYLKLISCIIELTKHLIFGFVKPQKPSLCSISLNSFDDLKFLVDMKFL